MRCLPQCLCDVYAMSMYVDMMSMAIPEAHAARPPREEEKHRQCLDELEIACERKEKKLLSRMESLSREHRKAGYLAAISWLFHAISISHGFRDSTHRKSLLETSIGHRPWMNRSPSRS